MMMKLVALLLLVITISAAPLGHGLIDQSPEGVQKWFEEFPNAKPKLTKLHFYLNNIASKKPPMSAPVAQAETTASSPTSFGLITVIDAALTATPGGKVIGRGQGFFTFSSQEELSALVTLNFVFTDGEFDGSTLSVLGRNPITQTYRELPVIGGSGAFRLAQGIATATTYYQNATAGDDIVEVHMVLYRQTLPGRDSDDSWAAEL
ncbi:OLC1v1013813C1 [Oldenlandia corymbosa var. corymbosa]|uniref:Dirigent protein n=1 Tax=Oldenlandia corymbosa var. corymbosa TaxID=529605 RepID=A0AAV1DZE1_OLDCO|nr:OLC1v1013813C1 [Oldenlandia corymbosa var. corymbosa]